MGTGAFHLQPSHSGEGEGKVITSLMAGQHHKESEEWDVAPVDSSSSV